VQRSPSFECPNLTELTVPPPLTVESSRQNDAQQHVLDVIQSIVVRNSKDTETEVLDRASIIVSSIRMAVAVNFDDESLLAADEIDDIAPDGRLAIEFQTGKLSVSQTLPDETFRGG